MAAVSTVAYTLSYRRPDAQLPISCSRTATYRAPHAHTAGDTDTSPALPALHLAALFKQATLGDVNIARPGGMFNFEANAKWDAWNALKGMSKEEAMKLYVEEIERQKAAYM